MDHVADTHLLVAFWNDQEDLPLSVQVRVGGYLYVS